MRNWTPQLLRKNGRHSDYLARDCQPGQCSHANEEHPMNEQDALEILATIFERQLRPAEAASEAMSVYLELGARIDELDVIRASAKQIVADILAEIGNDRLETPAGQCYVSRPSVRVSYDTRGLDKLAAERADLAGILALYRSEKEQPGTLTIRTGRN